MPSVNFLLLQNPVIAAAAASTNSEHISIRRNKDGLILTNRTPLVDLAEEGDQAEADGNKGTVQVQESDRA